MTIVTLPLFALAVALVVSVALNLYQKIKINRTLKILELKNQNIMLAIRGGNIAVWGYDVKHQRLYNIEGEVFIGDSVTVAQAMADVHPDDTEEFQTVFMNVINGVLPEDTVCVRFKNIHTGLWEYVEKEFAVIRSRSGEVETVIGTHKDVTKRVMAGEKTEELLKSYRELYDENQAILNSLPAGVSIYDKDGKMTFINQIICDMFCIKDGAKYSDRMTMDLLFPLMGEQAKNHIINGENALIHYQMDCNRLNEEFCLHKDKIVYVTCIFSVVRDEKGDIERYIFIHRDTTHEYEQLQQLREMSDMNKLILKNMRSGLAYISADKRVLWENTTDKFSPEFTANAKLFEVGRKCSETIMGSNMECDVCRMVLMNSDTSLRSIEKSFSNGNTVQIVGNPVVDDNGKLLGTILCVDDITERKLLYKDLEQSRNEALASNELMREILSRMPTALFIKDPDNDFRYVTVSKIFCDIFGKTPEDIIGKTDFEFIDHKLALGYRSDDQKVVDTNQAIVINEETDYNGTRRYWKAIKSSFTSVDNRKLLICILVDITEIRLVNDALQRAKNSAEESDRLKSAFLANMSHEIRTPLNAIVGFSELMQSSDDAAEKSEYMRIITANNELLLRLINDILDLSKLESGIIHLQDSEFDMALFFNEIAFEMKQRIKKPNIEFIAVNPCSSCIITTDKERMMQIWLNFMSNAIKYTDSGYIKMGYSPEDHGIKIYVEDSGIGVAATKRDKLFHRFEKLDSFAQGTGLGLSICKAIAELAGGKVGFESNQEHGSIFWAWMPLDAKYTYNNGDELPLSAEDKVEEKSCFFDDISKFNYNVLIAEDNDSNFMLLSKMLKNSFVIHRAVNGEQAVDIVRNNAIDIVLMDIRMPVMDGLQATKIIRVFKPQLPIIAVTANAFQANRDAAFAAGCTDFLSKPVRKDEVMTLMCRALQGGNV